MSVSRIDIHIEELRLPARPSAADRAVLANVLERDIGAELSRAGLDVDAGRVARAVTDYIGKELEP